MNAMTQPGGDRPQDSTAEGVPTALLRRVRYEIESLGFSIVEDAVPEPLLTRLRAELLEALRQDQEWFGHLPGKDPARVDNLVLHGGAFLELLETPVIRAVFRQVFDPHCIVYNYGSTVLDPGARPGASRIHVDAGRVIPGYASALLMTLALDPFTEENGATQYLPGSQEQLEPPEEALFARHAVSVARPRGAALFFNPRAWHRAGFNTTAERRCGLTLYAVRPFMKPRFDFPRFFTEEAAAALSPSLRSWLGFNARVPARMDEFYRPQEQRLYLGGQS
ncbi:phytanoyl-CoA dioxygenase family protein [Roseomonas sp. GC11]|uniref:phytanoyl-CoA dioxygenase family protein n=1 Tax=Roseomonas sp. GC11 TaxID=2950546 RepID=UPI00210ABB02|nr:phytanoyl-CoA dioxygenase family protein [Roseomonas sp. GC11]MCQ4161689.1 phytanoyl-CoA dioxygenase family protein [Roseomonas sp. GC11]